MRGRLFRLTIALFFAGIWPSGQTWAQARRHPGPVRSPMRQRGRPPRNPGANLERFEKMSPRDQQRALAQLPPERRARVEQQLNRLNRLSPAQREQLRKRYAEFQQLPPGRQMAVRRELGQLRAMPPAERNSRLKSEEFKKQFDKQERKILEEVSGNPGGL